MPRLNRPIAFLFVALTLITVPSCRYGPAPVNQPAIDPGSSGDLAMEMYDTNGDGKVAGDELEKAPGLKAALARLDTNADKAVTSDEVSERVEVWQRGGLGLMSFAYKVTMDGNPLHGATVTFEPEAFLGEEIQAGVGTTSVYGDGGATIPKENRPTPQSPPGMHLGLYKVKISKMANGKEMVPPKYNTETILGQEVAMDVPEIANNRVVYALRSN
jgi:hypothetical protein